MSMNKFYQKIGTTVKVVKINPDNCKNILDPKIYVVRFDNNKGYYLEESDVKFNLTGKIYGEVIKKANRIMTSFSQRPNQTTGVLLSGEKGSGKSMLMKYVANSMINKGLPVVLVNDSYSGDAFNEFITDLGECIILFDEFEKTYSEKEDQEAILTLLDGVSTSTKLVMFTVNQKSLVNEYMLNRPGRILFHIIYRGIDEDTIKEYCEENLIKKDQIQNIINLSKISYSFNFDILKALVEEMNRYDMTVKEAIEDFNIEVYEGMKRGNNKTYEVVELTWKDKPREPIVKIIKGNFFDRSVGIDWVYKDKENNEEWDSVYIDTFNLVDIVDKKYYFEEPSENVKVVVEEKNIKNTKMDKFIL